MKNAEELARYTRLNKGPMLEWHSREYKNAEKILNQWIKDFHIANRQDNELVYDISAIDIEGPVIVQGYISALTRCWEQYTWDTVTGALDILLQEMGEYLSERMRRQYPCLRHTHYVIMRTNKLGECVMYIGPYYLHSETACHLFGDNGVFMTQGYAACGPLFGKIGFFQ